MSFSKRNLIQVLFSWICILMFYIFACDISKNVIRIFNDNSLSENLLNKYENILLGFAGIMTAAIIVIMRFIKGDRKFLRFNKFKPSFLIKPLFIYLMLSGVSVLVSFYGYYRKSFYYVYKLFTEAEKLYFTDIFIKSKMFDFYFILNFVSLIILIPIYEEIIFRGIIYNDIKELFSIKSGIIVSGIIFGILHFDDGPILLIIFTIIVTTIYGFFAAYFYEKTKTLWAPIILHGLIHFFSLFPEFIFKWQIQIFCWFGFMITGVIIIIIESLKYLKRRKQNAIQTDTLPHVQE